VGGRVLRCGVVDERVPVAKIVGRRRTPAGLSSRTDTKADAAEWRRAFPTPFVPKGVYRFRSHEEADEWLWRMITRKARG
jgi:hypothetical protein